MGTPLEPMLDQTGADGIRFYCAPPPRMRQETERAPSTAFKKENGMWTFFVHPEGIQREAGDYPDEETAEDLSNRERLRWKENRY